MTDAVVKPMTRRHSIFLLGLWALGVGAALVVLGAWLWAPLIYVGACLMCMGIIWVAVQPLVSGDPVSPAHRRYLRTFLPAMGGYVLAILLLAAVRSHSLPLWVMALVALLPLLPMVWVVLSMWRYTRDSDELEQRLQLESVFITCGVVGLLAFAAGMLEMAGVVHLTGGLFYVLPLMFAVYGLAGWWCRRRYGLEGLC